MDERKVPPTLDASQLRTEKDKAPLISLPVSGFSNVDDQQLSSSRHGGSLDRPVSIDSNLRNHIAQSHTLLELEYAWYQIFEVLRTVRASRRVSGKEFNILNGWGFALTVFFHAVVFSVLAYFSIENTKIFTPISDKKLGILCMIGAWCLLIAELLFTSGYLMTKLKHPLVRSKGSVYLIMVSVALLSLGTSCTFTNLVRIGVINTNAIVVSLSGAIAPASTILLLGALAARQRLIYLLFEVKVSSSSNIYYQSYIWVALWSLLVGSVVFTLSCLDFTRFKRATYIVVNTGYYVVLAVLTYYSYKSRGIKLAFSDWRSNVVISLLCTVMSTFFTLVNALWLDRMTLYSLEWESEQIAALLIMFNGLIFSACVCTVFLFGQIALIVFFDLNPSEDLDPLSTFDFHLPAGGLSQYAPAVPPAVPPRTYPNPGGILSSSIVSTQPSTGGGLSPSRASIYTSTGGGVLSSFSAPPINITPTIRSAASV